MHSNCWYVLSTLPKHEKKININLQKNGFDTFLPLRTEIHHWRDRKVKVELPLFSCYLFINIPYSERFKVFKTAGIFRYLDSNASPTRVPDFEMDIIKNAGNSRFLVQEHVAGMGIGDTVIVSAGPFKGVMGRVVENSGIRRLVIEIASLNKKIIVDISGHSVERLNAVH